MVSPSIGLSEEARVISEAQLETLTPVTGDPIEYETLRAAHIIDLHSHPIPWQNRPSYRALARGAPPNEPGHAPQGDQAEGAEDDYDDEDAGDDDGADVEAQLPDAPPQQAGPSAPGTFSMDILMAQIDRLSGQIDSRFTALEAHIDARFQAQEARSRDQERRLRRIERYQYHYYSEQSGVPPPPLSPPPSP